MLGEKLCMTTSACLLPHPGLNHFRWVPTARLSRTKITDLNGRSRKCAHRSALERASHAFDVALRNDEIPPTFIARRHGVLSPTVATLQHLVVHSVVFLTFALSGAPLFGASALERAVRPQLNVSRL